MDHQNANPGNSAVLARFIDRSKRCGRCMQRYPTAKLASDCVTRRHGLIRCYICFKVCRNTERLFNHYGIKHQGQPAAGQGQAGSGTVRCGICNEQLLYKSVSTHVISAHLFRQAEPAPKKPTRNEIMQQQVPVAPPIGGSFTLNKAFFTTRKILDFQKKVKTCHCCNKRYKTASEASDCISNKHHLIRCYLCLAIVRNTEDLFKHFEASHKAIQHGGKLACQFCSKVLAFKSVSCHVISCHLLGTGANQQDEQQLPEVQEEDPNLPKPSRNARSTKKKAVKGKTERGSGGTTRKTKNTTSGGTTASKTVKKSPNATAVVRPSRPVTRSSLRVTRN